MDRIGVPANARSRRTRAALLDAARASIEEQGTRSLTMAGVAEAAGVSRRSAYLHFANRSELLAALFAHVADVEGLEKVRERVRAAPDAAGALDVWADAVNRYLLRIVRIARALRAERFDDADVAAHWAVVVREHHGDCKHLAQRLSDEGLLRAPWTVKTAADMLWSLMSVDLLDVLVNERGWSISGYVKHLQLMLRSTFLQ